MFAKKYSFLIVALLLISESAVAAKCLFVSSYHQGYEWSDGIEKALRRELGGKCELRQLDMDTKRNKTENYKKAAALRIKRAILSWQPDVVIVADDNAARYVLQPYFKNHRIPFVFCGINWNVASYGFPYDNATGMVEVAPVRSLFDKVAYIQGRPFSAFYVGADTLSEQKNLIRFQQEANNYNIRLHNGLAKTAAEWMKYYQQAQLYDFVIIGSQSGINDWNSPKILEYIKQFTDKLSVTNHRWMMPFSIFGLTKIPEEQGQWAAQVALYILDGARPSQIPIVANRKWDMWVNESLLGHTNITIPRPVLSRAKKIH